MSTSYEARIGAVVDHVRANLTGDLSLGALAQVAAFSPFHFHRIFRSVTGETLSDFTRRARLERAIRLMRASPDRPLGSIASEVGFATPSDFSRVFRSRFGCAPSSWDRRSGLTPVATAPSPTIPSSGRDPLPEPRVRRRPAARVAYIRVRRPWHGGRLAEAYGRLDRWLATRDVGPAEGELIGFSWESAKATPIDVVTYDLGVTVGPHVAAAAGADGGDVIGIHELPAVTAVEVHCTSLPATAAAWDLLYGTWLPGSRYEPDDVPALKRFRRRPTVLDDAAWDVDCSVALRERWP